MCGLRGRCVHIAEHPSTRRDRCPRSGTRAHQAGTLPDMREHCAAGSAPGFVRRPAMRVRVFRSHPGAAVPDRQQVTSRPDARHPVPGITDEAGCEPIEAKQRRALPRRGATGPAKTPVGEKLPEGLQWRPTAYGAPHPRAVVRGQLEPQPAAVEADRLRSPARWLRKAPSTGTPDPDHSENRRGTPKPSHDGPHPRLRCAVNGGPSPAWTRRHPERTEALAGPWMSQVTPLRERDTR